jgi:uncharacterized protein (DUF1501 family)
MSRRTASSRRDFLRNAAAFAAAGGLSPRLFAAPRAFVPPPPANAKLVLINLEGAYDSLSLVPPLTGTVANDYRTLRPLLAVRPAVLGQPAPLVQPIALPGVPAFGLHPTLGPIATEFAAGKCAIVQKVGLAQNQLSHFKARDVMAAGRFDSGGPDPRGWLGRLSDVHFATPEGVMGVGVQQQPVFTANVVKPSVITNLGNFALSNTITATETSQRRAALAAMCAQTFGGEARVTAGFRLPTLRGGTLSSSLTAATASITPPNTVVPPGQSFNAYGDPATENLAGSLADIAKLIAAPGSATRVFYTATGGFDTHGYMEEQGPANKPTLSARLAAVMQALGAFIADLKSPVVNQWTNTTICLFTEFGRRTAENQTRGTDHGRGFHAFVLGGGVLGGLKGATLVSGDLGMGTSNENLPVEIDVRGLFKKLVQNWLNLDPALVFDDYTPAPTEPSYTLF